MAKGPPIRFLLVLLFGGYLLYSGGFLRGITGLDSQQSVTQFVVKNVYTDKSCDVEFIGSAGEQTKWFPDCAQGFTFKPASNKFVVGIDSVSRGILRSSVGFKVMLDESGPDGRTVPVDGTHASDYSSDDLDWIAIGGCGSAALDIGEAYSCIRYWPEGSDAHCCGNVATLIDKSATFKLVPSYAAQGGLSGDPPTSVTFSIVNENYFASEDYAKTHLPNGVHYRPVDCPFLKDTIPTREVFDSGSVVTLQSFHTPVLYFCKSLPITSVSSSTKRILTDTTPYEKLVAGESVTVPAGEVWEFAYITTLTDNMRVRCVDQIQQPNDDGTCPTGGTKQTDGTCLMSLIWNSVDNRCDIEGSIVHYCTRGQWNGMACVVSEQNVCPDGMYDYGDGTCARYIPRQCSPACGENEICDPNYDPPKCVTTLYRKPVCPDVSVKQEFPFAATLEESYSEAADSCFYTAPLKPTCGNDEVLGVHRP